MAYNIAKTDGTILGTILDGTVDTSKTSLTLIGRNYSNYGQFMVDNLVSLVENFAYSISPSNPLAGQLWWDTDETRLKVYTGSAFKVISSATAATSAPTTTVAGDLWWDTTNDQLYIYNGTSPYNSAGWILVGPAYSKLNGKSGAIWEQIADTSAVNHNVVSIYLDGVRLAIVCDDAEWQPAVAISGFGNIVPGTNFTSAGIVNGTAYTADRLGGVVAANYLRTDIDNTATGNLRVQNNEGVTIGGNLDLSIQSGTTAGNVSIYNNVNDGDINVYTKTANTWTRAVYIDGTTAELRVNADPTDSTAVANKNYVDNSFVDSALTGTPTAPTANVGTNTTQVATTAFVQAAFNPANIFQLNSSLTISDTGSNGFANLVLDGVSVMTADSSGVQLADGSTATTQGQAVSNGTIATTSYVRTAVQRWDGAAKFVSTSAPDDGLGIDGDFWFQRET